MLIPLARLTVTLRRIPAADLARARDLRHRHRKLHDRAVAAAARRRPDRERDGRRTAGDGVRPDLCVEFAGVVGAEQRYRTAQSPAVVDGGLCAGQFHRQHGDRLLAIDGGADPARLRRRALCAERQRAGRRLGIAGATRHGAGHRQWRHQFGSRARRAARRGDRQCVRLAHDLYRRRRSRLPRLDRPVCRFAAQCRRGPCRAAPPRAPRGRRHNGRYCSRCW